MLTHILAVALAGEKSWVAFPSSLLTESGADWWDCSGPGPAPPPITQGCQDSLSVSTTNWASLTAVSLRARDTAQFQMWGEQAIEEGLGQHQPPRGELGTATLKPQEFKFGNHNIPGSSRPCTASILKLPDTAQVGVVTAFDRGRS